MWQDFEVEGSDGLTAYQPRCNFTVAFEGFQGMWTELSLLRQASLLRRSHSSPNSLTNSQKKKIVRQAADFTPTSADQIKKSRRCRSICETMKYLSYLQQHSKWTEAGANLQEPNAPPLVWPLAR
ncbi:unnamed protein product, partial [Nesidiocoris tenuis]